MKTFIIVLINIFLLTSIDLNMLVAQPLRSVNEAGENLAPISEFKEDAKKDRFSHKSIVQVYERVTGKIADVTPQRVKKPLKSGVEKIEKKAAPVKEKLKPAVDQIKKVEKRVEDRVILSPERQEKVFTNRKVKRSVIISIVGGVVVGVLGVALLAGGFVVSMPILLYVGGVVIFVGIVTTVIAGVARYKFYSYKRASARLEKAKIEEEDAGEERENAEAEAESLEGEARIAREQREIEEREAENARIAEEKAKKEREEVEKIKLEEEKQELAEQQAKIKEQQAIENRKQQEQEAKKAKEDAELKIRQAQEAEKLAAVRREVERVAVQKREKAERDLEDARRRELSKIEQEEKAAIIIQAFERGRQTRKKLEEQGRFVDAVESSEIGEDLGQVERGMPEAVDEESVIDEEEEEDDEFLDAEGSDEMLEVVGLPEPEKLTVEEYNKFNELILAGEFNEQEFRDFITKNKDKVVDIEDSTGNSLLHAVAFIDEYDLEDDGAERIKQIVSIFKESGFDFEKRNDNGETALFLGVVYSASAFTNSMLEADVNIFVFNNEYRTLENTLLDSDLDGDTIDLLFTKLEEKKEKFFEDIFKSKDMAKITGYISAYKNYSFQNKNTLMHILARIRWKQEDQDVLGQILDYCVEKGLDFSTLNEAEKTPLMAGDDIFKNILYAKKPELKLEEQVISRFNELFKLIVTANNAKNKEGLNGKMGEILDYIKENNLADVKVINDIQQIVTNGIANKEVRKFMEELPYTVFAPLFGVSSPIYLAIIKNWSDSYFKLGAKVLDVNEYFAEKFIEDSNFDRFEDKDFYLLIENWLKCNNLNKEYLRTTMRNIALNCFVKKEEKDGKLAWSVVTIRELDSVIESYVKAILKYNRSGGYEKFVDVYKDFLSEIATGLLFGVGKDINDDTSERGKRVAGIINVFNANKQKIIDRLREENIKNRILAETSKKKVDEKRVRTIVNNNKAFMTTKGMDISVMLKGSILELIEQDLDKDIISKARLENILNILKQIYPEKGDDIISVKTSVLNNINKKNIHALTYIAIIKDNILEQVLLEEDDFYTNIKELIETESLDKYLDREIKRETLFESIEIFLSEEILDDEDVQSIIKEINVMFPKMKSKTKDYKKELSLDYLNSKKVSPEKTLQEKRKEFILQYMPEELDLEDFRERILGITSEFVSQGYALVPVSRQHYKKGDPRKCLSARKINENYSMNFTDVADVKQKLKKSQDEYNAKHEAKLVLDDSRLKSEVDDGFEKVWNEAFNEVLINLGDKEKLSQLVDKDLVKYLTVKGDLGKKFEYFKGFDVVVVENMNGVAKVDPKNEVVYVNKIVTENKVNKNRPDLVKGVIQYLALHETLRSTGEYEDIDSITNLDEIEADEFLDKETLLLRRELALYKLFFGEDGFRNLKLGFDALYEEGVLMTEYSVRGKMENINMPSVIDAFEEANEVFDGIAKSYVAVAAAA